jgi:hypothetical protein
MHAPSGQACNSIAQCSIPTVNSLVDVSMVNADGMAETLTLRASCTMAIATVAAITAGQRVCAHAAIIPCFGVFWCQMMESCNSRSHV